MKETFYRLFFLFSNIAEKYCPILVAEDGLSDVRRLIEDPRPYPRIKELANIVFMNYQSYVLAHKVLNWIESMRDVQKTV